MMDKKSFIDTLFFFFVLSFIILPPLFVQSAGPGVFTTWTFPLMQMLYAYIAGIILWFFYIQKRQKNSRPQSVKRIVFFVNSGYALVTFGALSLTASVTELFFHLRGMQSPVIPSLPSSAAQFFFCVLNFIFASFFEEVLYRLYLPDMLFRFISYIPHITPKLAAVLGECAAVLLFAFAHRYLGAASVVNAAAACVILRICCKKSGTVWTNTAAHFAYNILSLILVSVL